MRHFIHGLAILLVSAFAPLPLSAAVFPLGFSETVIVSGLSVPTAFVFTPDGRILIAEKGGTVRVFKNGALLPQSAIGVFVTSNSERGLLGIALDPDFTNNGWVYLYYTTSAGSFQPSGHPYSSPKNRVARFTMSGDIISTASQVILVDDINSDAGNHNAGHLQFGPDGKLYISTGDGGALPSRSQMLDDLAGKILRINADGTIPPDNPFPTGVGGRAQIWCYGLRNPWRFTFDSMGRLFIGDVGGSSWEEINVGMPGANYGWPIREGIVGDGDPNYVDPIYAYPHGSGASISLGTFDTSGTYPAPWGGGLFFGDYVQGFVRVLQYSSGTAAVSNFGTVDGNPIHFGATSGGLVHYLAISDGEIRRIDYAQRALTLMTSGGGVVSSSPAGINCGSDCQEFYQLGMVVTLSAAPSAGQGFAGWGGADDCRDGVVTLSADLSCSAPFVQLSAGPPVIGDIEGDGRADLLVYRPSRGLWSWRSAATSFSTGRDVMFGAPSDIPVAADYNGDGRLDFAVFSPASALWQIAGVGTVQFGQRGDIPVPADYNGDGIVDIAVFRPGSATWYVRDQFERQFGAIGDMPVPARYNGAGSVDLAVFRPASALWLVMGRSPVQFGQRGDLPVPADYNGDGTADVAVYRRATNTWLVMGSAVVQIGGATALPIPMDLNGDGSAELVTFERASAYWSIRFSSMTTSVVQHGMVGDWPGFVRRDVRLPRTDFDGDRRADIAVYRPSTGVWYPAFSSADFNHYGTVQFGSTSDVAVAGDYDGDRLTDVAVFRPSTGIWYLGYSSTAFSSYAAVKWGISTDTPVPGDYDGDGRTDVAVFRPSTGTWYLGLSSENFENYIAPQLGQSGDIPVPGDYDGDGRTDIGVFRPSTGAWFLSMSSSGFGAPQTLMFGVNGDVPTPGDYDADGRVDIAVFRPSNGFWYAATSSSGFNSYFSLAWGVSGDIPVASDFDGDGHTDLAVYRPSTGVWYPGYSSTGFSFYASPQWGISGDAPTSGQPSGF